MRASLNQKERLERRVKSKTREADGVSAVLLNGCVQHVVREPDLPQSGIVTLSLIRNGPQIQTSRAKAPQKS
jgi:hypothetical protein